MKLVAVKPFHIVSFHFPVVLHGERLINADTFGKREARKRFEVFIVPQGFHWVHEVKEHKLWSHDDKHVSFLLDVNLSPGKYFMIAKSGRKFSSNAVGFSVKNRAPFDRPSFKVVDLQVKKNVQNELESFQLNGIFLQVGFQSSFPRQNLVDQISIFQGKKKHENEAPLIPSCIDDEAPLIPSCSDQNDVIPSCTNDDEGWASSESEDRFEVSSCIDYASDSADGDEEEAYRDEEIETMWQETITQEFQLSHYMKRIEHVTRKIDEKMSPKSALSIKEKLHFLEDVRRKNTCSEKIFAQLILKHILVHEKRQRSLFISTFVP
jgi:hypothetical protein